MKTFGDALKTKQNKRSQRKRATEYRRRAKLLAKVYNSPPKVVRISRKDTGP